MNFDNPCSTYCLFYRLLQSNMGHFSSSQHQREQVETKMQQLQELQEQIAALPVLFPWPGLIERKEVLKQAHCLLVKAKALVSEITALKLQMREQAELSQDASWTDLPWDNLETCASRLAKQISVSNFGHVLHQQPVKCARAQWKVHYMKPYEMYVLWCLVFYY